MKFAGQRRSFEEDWRIHSDSSEWWYSTGYGRDAETNKLFSFQFSLIRVTMPKLPIHPYIVQIALTDFETKEHLYVQETALLPWQVKVSDTELRYKDMLKVTKEAEGIRFAAKTEQFNFEVFMDYGKGPFWHCDNGLLQMGLKDPKQVTYYYSYTNMPCRGTINCKGKQYQVEGKSWFDKQGGTYELDNPKCMWEWFSLRFYDNEEMMLFTFPQHPYSDGTYIKSDCTSERLNNYQMEALDFVKPDGKTVYSTEWKLTVPGKKEEVYYIRQLMEGVMLNVGYYELLAGIYNEAGEEVGMCFVELLPGARNETMPEMTLFTKSGK